MSCRNSFRSIAVERFHICQSAAALPSRTLVSFDAGLNLRPVKVSLQNVFCDMLNVTVVYPFGGAVMQKALFNTHHPTSYLIEALGFLHSPQPHNGLYSAPNALFQPVCRATTSPVREWNFKKHKSCKGLSCVDKIVLYTTSNRTHNFGLDVETMLASDPALETKIELLSPTVPVDHTTNDMANTDTTASAIVPALPDPLLNIWRAVHPYTTQDGIIVLLLVTRGYADMLTNFLCSARALNFWHFLILTHDAEIINIATIFNVGYYSPPMTFTYATPASNSTMHHNANDDNNTSSTPADADFGTIRYQELIYSRTELTLQLLLCGYLPIIADVDAVWLSNPLEQLPWSQAYLPTLSQQQDSSLPSAFDIAITDDYGEVCGCFVALRATAASIHFWSQVTTQHRDLIRFTLDNVRAFDESEQKILTRLLYGKEYKHSLSVFQLPKEYFPSGYEYFNLQTHRVRARPPAVVHNNFIIGKALKRARFQRYGMWSVLNNTAVRMKNAEGDICIADLTLHTYANLFTTVSRNITIPSLNLYLPVHNSVIYSETNMAHASAEGPTRIIYKQDAANFNFVTAKLHIDNHPPSYLDASPAVFGVLNMALIRKNTIAPYTLVTRSDAVSVSVDVGYYRDVFSMDRDNKFLAEANEYVLQTIRESNLVGKKATSPDEAASRPTGDELQMTYSIRIITYNRPRSLQRLLASLLAADYAGYANITLHIAVDASKTQEVDSSVAEVTLIAEEFEWPYGPKSLKLHATNVGLVSQWLNVWIPASDHEAAFILEDDMEVSPYFFVWAVRAAEKYYIRDTAQQTLHAQLLDAVEKFTESDAAVPDGRTNNSTNTPLQEFIRTSAGRPLLYGICLQKQHLDPNHHPKKLLIRNGHRPFLYSLVGSWAPLMLAQPWRAFLAWQSEQVKRGNFNTTADAIKGVPLTERLVTNHFLEQNPRIWTPWHIRFAFETGAKCLYSNLPGEHALVVNHREAGENYATHGGPDGELISRILLEDLGLLMEQHKVVSQSEVLFSCLKIMDRVYELPVRPTENEVLKWSLLHLPDLSTLVKYQYDFNLRRAGALGADRTHHSGFSSKNIASVAESKRTSKSCTVCGDLLTASGIEHGTESSATRNNNDNEQNATSSQELAMAWAQVHDAIQLQSIIYHTNQPTRSSSVNTTTLSTGSAKSPVYAQLSAEHWVSVVDLVESTILFGATILHLSYTPLDLSDLVEGQYTMLVLDAVQLLSVRYAGHAMIDVYRALNPVEYLLVLGAGSSAPTDLTVQYNNQANPTEYVMVEDVCSIVDEDVGAVLYRDVTRVNIPKDRRFSVSRRLTEELQTRRVVDAQGL
eukprot:gene10486-12250_t